MILTQKIRAGALQFVLFIGAVIAILLMSFLLLSNTHSFFNLKTEALITVIKSADFGLDASFAHPIPVGGKTTIQNENEIPITIEVTRDWWGAFEKRTVVAAHGNTKKAKTVLVGGGTENGTTALYLRDTKRPLVIAGNALITGDAFLPEQGLKVGNIYGNSYHRDRLLYGKRKQSDSLLPPLNRELLDQIKNLTSNRYTAEGEPFSLVKGMELRNSFLLPTRIVRERIVHLKDIRLSGNILISATDKIIVEASAVLEDVVLLAPKIIIKDWTKGYFQAIASESIQIGKKCELSYPTALLVNKKPVFTSEEKKASPVFDPPRIYIDSYTEVNGMVMVLEETNIPQYAPQIKIDENAKVMGEVYCTKALELKGRVNGSVVTNAFIAMENGSAYQNHLYNGVVNRANLPTAYSGLVFAKAASHKKIVKWLY